MSRRTAIVVLVLSVLVVGAPVFAHDQSGSGEEQKVTRSCGATADPHYSPPGPGDCRNERGEFDATRSYQSTYYSNDVRCGSTNQLTPAALNATGIRVYGATSGTNAGYASTCTDGTGTAPNPIQGRATVQGSTTSGGTVTVDGDKHNPLVGSNPSLRGWIRVAKGADASAPSYVCGDEHDQGGRADSDHPEARDTQAECAN